MPVELRLDGYNRGMSEEGVAAPPTRMRFSIRALLGATALACVLLAPVPVLGAWYLSTAVVCLAVLGLTSAFHLRGWHFTGVGLSVAFVFLGQFMLYASIPFFIYTLFNFTASLLLGLGSLVKRPRRQETLLAFALAFVVPFISLGIYGLQSRRAYDRQRSAHLPESLVARLAPLENNDRLEFIEAPMSPEVMKELRSRENERTDIPLGRRYALATLVNDGYRRRLPGEVFRPPAFQGRYSDARFEFERASEAELPLPVADRYAAQPDELHSGAVGEFLDQDRIGFSPGGPGKVLGFEPHAFTRFPEWAGAGDRSGSWQLSRLGFVSLLRHQEPVVYEMDELRTAEEVASLSSRPTNEFEGVALDKILRETDVFVDEERNRIRVLGAVRAGLSCVVCHSSLRGDLLGAFSYELRREEPAE